MTLLILGPPRLGTKSETYNFLTLICLDRVEPNTLVIVPLKPLVKLRFGFGIMPLPRTFRQFLIFIFSICSAFYGWFYRFRIAIY